MLLHHLQWVLLAFFMIPLIETIMMIVGSLNSFFNYVKRPDKFSKLIIQFTTVGKERDLVQSSINTINGYGLKMAYEIWVVIEPGFREDYDNVGRVIVVPAEFECKPIEKARALEFTRRLRKRLGLNKADVKIVLADDDTLPSKKYLKLAFAGDYDICQGITVPNRWFAYGKPNWKQLFSKFNTDGDENMYNWRHKLGRQMFVQESGFKHFFLSHLDNIRTRNCLIYCSCTQGVTQKPLFVHGEGLCITGRCEDIVTWDRPIVASDDLVFGTNAAHMGMSWGYFQAAIQLVSPWSWRENLKQRRRWTWGNFDAIGNREIMPRGAAIFKGFKYAIGFVSVLCSGTGAVLLASGFSKIPPQAHYVFWASLTCWFVTYGLSGWINAGGQPNHSLRPQAWRFWGFRVVQTMFALILTPLVALMPIVVIVTSIFRGRPTKFLMIDKQNSVMDLSA